MSVLYKPKKMPPIGTSIVIGGTFKNLLILNQKLKGILNNKQIYYKCINNIITFNDYHGLRSLHVSSLRSQYL